MNRRRWMTAGLMAIACALCLSGSRSFAADTRIIARWSIGPAPNGGTFRQTVYSDGIYLWVERTEDRSNGRRQIIDRQGLALGRIGCVRLVRDRPRMITVYSKSIGGAVEYSESGTVFHPDAVTIADDLTPGIERTILRYPPVHSKVNACRSRVDLYGLHFVQPPANARVAARYMQGRSSTEFLTDGVTLFLRTHSAYGGGVYEDDVSEVQLAKIACVNRGDTYINVWPQRPTDVLTERSDDSSVHVGYLLEGSFAESATPRVWDELARSLPALASKLSPKKCIVVSG